MRRGVANTAPKGEPCLLKYIIQNAFNKNIQRLWVHTCSLDHKHALNNYLSKGLQIFREEEIDFTL